MSNGSKYRRCPYSQLTELQAHVIAAVALARGHYDAADPHTLLPHGVIRSLVIRGLLCGKRQLTAEGKAALLPRRRAA